MDLQDDPIRQAYQPECIFIQKLYDWVYKPFSTTTLYKTVLDITTTPVGADLAFYTVVSTVSYYLTIVPDPINPVTITLGTPQFNVPVTVGGNPATVTCLPITKVVKFTLVANPTSGATRQASASRTMALTEKVALCLPQEIYNAEVEEDDGKYINITTPRILLTAVDNGTLGTVSGNTVPFSVNVNFLLCQDIKIIYPVVFRVDGTFCSPRPDDITCPLDPGCPALTFPAQCPNVFPRTPS